MSELTIKRCAVYCRKSTEIGLEQDYNSLDAQRESAENYIKSQKHNGWELLPEHYDDGGYSGGNTERPALKRLMADIEAGKIDVLVLYKLDRLSRSLLDFMKLAEFFEKHNVSFVSVTQEINTSTSSGRMMLNILMTFSEFERAVVTERILDKIAGAKRRGKHCGGTPILGYDANPKTKKLEINVKEAAIVRDAFSLYVKFGSVLEVTRLLNAKGYKTKDWVSKKGKRHGGTPFIDDTVYRMLNTVTYTGLIPHKEKRYPGEQDAIISMELWEKTRQIMADNAATEPGSRRTPLRSPFKGLIKCGYCGGSFGLTYAYKNDHRYMYYICIKDDKRVDKECPLRRFAASDLDRAILEQLGRIFQSPSVLVKAHEATKTAQQEHIQALLITRKELEAKQDFLRQEIVKNSGLVEFREQLMAVSRELDSVNAQLKNLEGELTSREVMEACGSLNMIWEELFPAERCRLANLLLDKITVFTDKMIMDVKATGLKSLVKEFKADERIAVSTGDGDIIRLEIPFTVRRRHGRKILLPPSEVVEDSGENVEASPILARHLARAHAWMAMIESGEVEGITPLAEKFGLDQSYVSRTLKLVNLAPEIQQMIVNGKEPAGLTVARLRQSFPDEWKEQKKVLLVATVA